MISEIVPARPNHCGAISRRLRREHGRILADMRVQTHRELRNAFDASTVAKSWIVDGKVMAVGGITGSMAAAEGSIWLAVSEEATSQPIAFAREMLRQLELTLKVKRRLTTVVLRADKAGMRFAYFLGFHVERETEVDGEKAAVMVIER